MTSPAQALQLAGVRAGYERADVIQSVDLNANGGMITWLVGPNGAGKTTLLRAIGGSIKTRAGTITWRGQNITGQTASARAASGLVRIAEPGRVFGLLSVLENLQVGAYALGRRPDRRQLDYVYDLFPVLKRRHSQLALTLSGGEQRMLSIGRGLMADAAMLLIDEPTLGLAPTAIVGLSAAIRELLGRGMGMLVAEQNLGFADSLPGRTYLVQRGRVTWEGESGTLKTSEQVTAAVLGGGLSATPSDMRHALHAAEVRDAMASNNGPSITDALED